MTSMPVAQHAHTIRALAPDDLPAVVAIDAAAEGHSRRDYVERRLRAAQREPELHAQFAAADDAGVVGFMLARVLAGEFGQRRRALRLEALGVRADRRGFGVGRSLFEVLAAWGARHDCSTIRTTANWQDTALLDWFDSLGFELAPEVILHCRVDGSAGRSAAELPLVEPVHEIDYGRDEANDHERLGRDAAQVASMTRGDLDAIVRIDRLVTGRDRRDYITSRLDEALDNTSVRVSLTARCDGAVVGMLMARADLGDFGRPEAVAVLDTLGVDPDYARRGIGRALLAQLFAHLDALRVEGVETIVPLGELELLSFLRAVGFEQGRRLSFVRRLGSGR